MSNIGLFVVGGVVTILVAASMALLIWGAILDGRDATGRREAEHEAAARTAGDETAQPVGGTLVADPLDTAASL